MDASVFLKNCLKSFMLVFITITINFFVFYAYGVDVQEITPLQSDQKSLCAMNLSKNPPVQLSPQDRALINHQPVPFSSSYVINSVQHFLGNFIFSPISFSSISDLAEDIYRNKGRYDLVFKGLKGTFTDTGIFDSLEGHPHVIRISANETKTFYIHVIPSSFDSFIIYLVNKTPFGEVLSYIDNHVITGALISWFKEHFDEKEMEFSTFIFLDEVPITLNGIFREIHAEGPLPENLRGPKNFTYKGTENHWLDLETLSEVHEITRGANLVSTIQLTTLQNRLQALQSLDIQRIVDAFTFYSDLEMPQGKSLQNDDVRNATLFTVFLDVEPHNVEPHDMLDTLNYFQLFGKSSYRSFLRKALLLQLVLAEIKSLYNPNTEKLSVRQMLDRTNYIYNRFKEERNASVSEEESLQNTYLAAILKGEDQVSKDTIDNAENDIKLIESFFSGDYDEDDRAIYSEGAVVISVRTPQSTRKHEKSHVRRLLLMSYAWGIPIDSLLNSFNRILQSVGNIEVALILLKAVKLGYILNDIIDLFQSANEFFKNEGLNSTTIAELVVLGLLTDLYPEQIITIYKEALARLEHQNVSRTLIIDFVNSTINLRAKPYEDIILSNTGVMKAVRHDENGNIEVVPTLHVKDYLMLQVVDWIEDL